MVVAKRTSPLLTGIVPRDDVEVFLTSAVVPRYWPDARLVTFELVRSRFTAGEECAAIASLTLDPMPLVAPRVVVTFAETSVLEDAVLTYELGPLALELAVGAPDDAPSALDAAEQPVYSRDLACLAELFPSDWRMPALRTAMSPESMLPVIRRAAGAPEAVSLDVKLLRHRPHSRSVVLYVAKDADGRVVAEAVGKVYRSEGKSKRMWKVLETVSSRSKAGPIIPEPLERLKDAAFLLMSKAPGRSLQAILTSPHGVDLRAQMRLAASALRAFHAIDPDGFKRRKVDKDIEDCEEALENCEAGRAGDVRAAELVQELKQRANKLRTAPTVLIHGGFKPSAVLVDGDDCRLVDLDACSAGDAARDAGCFTAKLRALSLTPGQEHLEALGGDFLRAYTLDAADPEFEQRVRFYEAIFLTQTGLKHLSTSWRGEAEASPGHRLLAAARESLSLSHA